METDVLSVVEEQTERSEDQFCHLRHVDCPSLFSYCGALKPYSHTFLPKNMGVWKVGEKCGGCGKEICHICIAFRKCPHCKK